MDIATTFETTSETDAVLPKAAMNRLPLSQEALSAWSNETDLKKFLFDLYDGTGYGDYSDYCFENAKKIFNMWSIIFHEAASEALPSPGSKDKDIKIPDFKLDPLFGRAAKCMSVWENSINNILSEGSHFSISHILESKTDLTSSIHLAAHLYYRQAFQVLRGFIESVILPVHFCGNPEAYTNWKSNSYRVPSFRGKGGLLEQMKKLGVLPNDIADETSHIYGVLNGYIHGSEEHLNNTGINIGQWSGFVYQQSMFELWASTFSNIVELGIRILRIHHEQWEAAKSTYGLFCNVCHGIDFEEEAESSADDLIKYKCNQCGSLFHMSKEKERVVVTSIKFDS